MKTPAPSSSSTCLSSIKATSTGLHDERLHSYVKVVNFLLATYANDDVIAQAVKELESYHQGPGVLASDYSKDLYSSALRCVIVYEEKWVNSLSVDGIEESVRNNVRWHWSENPSEPLTQLARYVKTMERLLIDKI